MDFPVGTRIGPYEIVAPLGAGAMGIVYRAADPRLGREVAIKVLLPRFAADPERIRRFLREARAAAALNHPNIVAIHDLGTHEGLPYLVCELLEGETLRERLKRGPLPADEALECGMGIARGLAAAHGKGVVHRDLKPENVFLTCEGQVKVLDFGLAKLMGDRGSDVTLSMTTEPGVVLGTMGYISPEMLQGFPVDWRADIFAFGAILHEVLTGQRAFRGATAVETIASILHVDPLTPAPPGLLPPLLTLLRRCLEKDPGARPPAADLILELEGAGRDSPGLRSVPVSGRSARPTGSRTGTARRPTMTSLAVLPFTNLAADPATEYLSDGIAERLLHKLSPLPGLRVLGRATAFRFRGREHDPVSVGRELGVDGVVTGRVLKAGDRFVVRAELTAVADGSQVWGAQYDRAPAELLSIQEDIGRKLAARLRPKLTGVQRKRLGSQLTENVQAYDLYLKGRHLWNRFTQASWEEGIACFRQAIEIDPGYALAYSGLADCFTTLAIHVFRPRDWFPQAAAAARLARELAPDLAEALASSSAVSLFWNWDLEAAERYSSRAIAQDPGYAAAYQVHAYTFSVRGDMERALAALGRAVHLDPLSALISGDVAYHLYLSGRYGEALDQARSTIASDPRLFWAHEVLGLVQERLGLREEAVTSFRRAAELSGSPVMAAFVAYGLAKAGQPDEAGRRVAQLERTAEDRYVPPTCLALALGALGEMDRALAWLEKAYEERDRWLLWHRDPAYDSLRQEPGFQELVRKLGPRG